jgi:chromosome segregation ATPase
MRLYELTEQYAALCERAFEESDDEGQLSAEFTALLNALEGGVNEKFEQCGFALRNMQAMETALKTEAERLSRRKSQVEDRIDRLKDYLKDQMNKLGETKRQAGIFTFAIRANGGNPAVKVLNEDLIPEDYWYQPPAVPDKTLIIEVSKTGAVVPGVELVRGNHLRVS